MKTQKEWENEKKVKTIKLLTNLNIDFFLFSFPYNNKGCKVVNSKGDQGFIKLIDALNCSYKIYDRETVNLIACYDSIAQLINDNWVIEFNE